MDQNRQDHTGLEDGQLSPRGTQAPIPWQVCCCLEVPPSPLVCLSINTSVLNGMSINDQLMENQTQLGERGNKVANNLGWAVQSKGWSMTSWGWVVPNLSWAGKSWHWVVTSCVKISYSYRALFTSCYSKWIMSVIYGTPAAGWKNRSLSVKI